MATSGFVPKVAVVAVLVCLLGAGCSSDGGGAPTLQQSPVVTGSPTTSKGPARTYPTLEQGTIPEYGG